MKNVFISDELHQALRIWCANHNRKISNIITEAVIEIVNRDPVEGLNITIEQPKYGRPVTKKAAAIRWPLETRMMELEIGGNDIPDIITAQDDIKEPGIIYTSFNHVDSDFLPKDDFTAAMMSLYLCNEKLQRLKTVDEVRKVSKLDGCSNIVEVSGNAETGFIPVNETAKILASMPPANQSLLSKYFLFALHKCGFFIKYL